MLQKLLPCSLILQTRPKIGMVGLMFVALNIGHVTYRRSG